MAEYTYTVEKPCPVCGKKTHATKMKARLITLGTDEDFCVHYEEGRTIHLPYSEERTVEEAIRAYKLGIYFVERLGWPLQKKAGYCMGMAWVYRDAGEHEKEAEVLRLAAEFYEKSVMTEHYPINGMSDSMALYIAGAAYYRMGDYEKATQMLSQIMSDQEVRKNDEKLFERAQNLWIDLREKKAAAEKANS